MAHSGVVSPGASMSDRNQITITLSDQALEDFKYIAEKHNIPLATFLRQLLEEEHRSPSFGALLRRYLKGREDE